MAATAAAAGAAVGRVTHNRAHAEELVAQVVAARPGEARIVADVAEVTHEEDLLSAMARLRADLGPFDGLVNVVGGSLGEYARAVELELHAFERVLTHNLRYVVVRAVGSDPTSRGSSPAPTADRVDGAWCGPTTPDPRARLAGQHGRGRR